MLWVELEFGTSDPIAKAIATAALYVAVLTAFRRSIVPWLEFSYSSSSARHPLRFSKVEIVDPALLGRRIANANPRSEATIVRRRLRRDRQIILLR
jgi:hypothetical protein